MKSLRRTNAIDFTEISDDDSYYSAGETSDDMISDNLSSANVANDKSFSIPDPLSSFISMQQHLSAIDTKVSDRSQISPILPFDDEDFNLERLNRPFTPKNAASSRVKQETIGCVIINIAHAAHYKEVVSEYFNTNKRFIAWNEIPYTQKTLPKFNSNKSKIDTTKISNQTTSTSSDASSNISDFPLTVHSFYKDAYNSYKTQIRFVHFASPSAEKLDTIRNARKEIPDARVLFHYVGYGYPDPDDGCIYTCEGKNSSMIKYKIEKLMDYIKPPSMFIFDCNKAGLLFNALINHARHNFFEDNEKNSQNPSNDNRSSTHTQASWRDWYCLCSSMNECNLPSNSKLPRDFLTSCLLSPIQTSILCHIVKYYNTTPEFGPEPFEYVKKNFNKFNNGKINEMVEILHAIADSIASEVVTPFIFSQIFRADSFISSLFCNFMLAQYLLRPYGVHPISFPYISDSAGNHPMWMEWTSTLDTLITSTLSPLPSFTTNLFCRVSTIFNTLASSLYYKTNILPESSSNSITQSILTLMCHAVLLNNYNSKKGNNDLSKNGNRSMNQNLSLLQSSSSSNYYSSLESSTSNLISSNKLKSKPKNLQSSGSSIKSDDAYNTSTSDFLSDDRISYSTINQLAEYASKSKKNRECISRSIHFGLLFKKLLKYLNDGSSTNLNLISNTIKFDTNYPKIIKKDEFHALCYLIVSLLQTDMNLFFEMKSDSDFSRLPSLLFDKSFSQATLTLVAAILASTIFCVNSVKILCSSHDFLLKLKEAIPTFSPPLLTWTLILLKKTFDNSSIDEDKFNKDSIHMQVAACIFHEDYQCRAATISTLPCFMQQKSSKPQNSHSLEKSPTTMIQMNMMIQPNMMNPMSQNHNFDNSPNFSNLSPSSLGSANEYEDENPINKSLFFIPFPCFCDISYLVRFQYLLFVIRFLTASRSLYEKMLSTPSSSPSSLTTHPTLGSAPTSAPNMQNPSMQSIKHSSQSIKGAIGDLHSKIHEMKDIDTKSFKNIVDEWMCLVKNTLNLNSNGSLSRGSDLNSLSSSFPNTPINGDFNRSSDSISDNGSLSFEYGVTNFDNYAKIVDFVCKRDDVKIRMYAMSLFMLDYFSHDPHPSIRSTANKARLYFGIEQNKTCIITTASSNGTSPTSQLSAIQNLLSPPPPSTTIANSNSVGQVQTPTMQPPIYLNNNDSNVKNTSSSNTSNSFHSNQSSGDQIANKTKGNFFSHFNKKQQQPNQNQNQNQQDSSGQNPSFNTNSISTNQADSSYISGSASPIFPSPIAHHLTNGNSASSFQNSFQSHSDPISNSSSSSANANSTRFPPPQQQPQNQFLIPNSSYYLENYIQEIALMRLEEEPSESSNDSSQSCTFFESDSQALFNLSLKKITKGGQWSATDAIDEDKEKALLHSKIRRISMRFSNLGKVEVPAISIQLRAQTKYLPLNKNSNNHEPTPTFISHDKESMNLVVSTNDHHVYVFDESLSVVNRINSGESDVSDLKFVNNIFSIGSINDPSQKSKRSSSSSSKNDLYATKSSLESQISSKGGSSDSSKISKSSAASASSSASLCAFASCDGSIRLWDPKNNQPCLLWRASSSFNDDKTPLFFTSSEIDHPGTNNYTSHIITARGSDEICVWDLMTQKLVCEYMTTSPVVDYKKQVSAISIHPTDPNVLVVGYTNGLISSIDTRASAKVMTTNQSMPFASSAVSNVSLSFSLPGEKIVSFCKNTNGGDFLYAATSNGNAVVWNTTSGMINTLYLSRKYGITSFSVHQMLPLIAYSNKSQAPMIVSCQSKVLVEMNAPSAPPNSLVTFHPIFPIITFASTNGELTSYNIVVSH